MIDWFNSFPDFVQGVIVLATIATVILIFQIVMLLVGFGSDHDFDGDMADDVAGGDDPFNDSGFVDLFGLKILTVRNFICFFAVGGWALVAIYDASGNYVLSILLGILCGFITMVLFAYAMKMAMKLQNDGTKDIKNSIGKIGTVYLRIPGEKKGKGKVHVIIQESLVEFEAMTEDLEEIKTGSEVMITDVCNDYLIVKKV